MKTTALRRSVLRVLLAAAMLSGVLPQSAWAWWNQEWSYRKQILIDASPKGGDLKADLSQVPVLIRLHEGVFNFTDASTDGSDLRFVADDDKTPLKFHIEKYDSVFNLAFVWVQLPTLKAGQVTKLWMYYGSRKGVGAPESRETYDPDQVLVYHFGERGAAVRDATGYANNSKSIVEVDGSGLIGNAAKFDGQSVVVVPASPSLSFPDAAPTTLSMWIKPTLPNEDAILYARREDQKQWVVGLSKGAPYVEVSDASGATLTSPSTQSLGGSGWHHLAVTAAGRIQLYVDGEPGPAIDAPLPGFSGPATLGADATLDPAQLLQPFSGEIDEFQLARVARSPAWLYFEAQNQGSNDKFVGFGPDEQLSSWSSGYFSIILRSVTADGWVVIGILTLMALSSWGVMVAKAQQVRRVTRGNRAFLELFRTVGGDFAALGHIVAGTAAVHGAELDESRRQLIQQAPLFHMFTVGIEELRGRLKADPHQRSQVAALSPQSMEAIRASLDSSLVEETEALNNRMVLLTIAIAGGPFLGLLGTVVGVMITFASIAASGDVNINAIAPGISAALMATVAGLVVAIPALFGYNYLITRIKQTVTRMQVFLDAFITRMGERYDEPRTLVEE